MKRLTAVVLLATLSALLFGAEAAMAQQVHNAKYPKDPATAALLPDEMGQTITLTLDNSAIYSGTTREIKVYIPAEYSGEEPAALLVCLDGVLFNAITVMQNLIKSGEMPLTIGVFIQPGVVYSGTGEILRYNRSNEFDRVDGTFASFIEREVLPLVESCRTREGKPLLISRNPDDRAITGASSGAICAFTAAWFRPDLFHRVYCSVGTFVSMRGGNRYPWIIRKTEPKPLRIYLQDGVNDAWNPLFGEWWEANQLMEAALDFAGYELFFKWDRGGHSIKHGTALFPDAMRWLWKGWPAPVESGRSRNDMLQALLPPVEKKATQSSILPWSRYQLTKEEARLMEEAGKDPLVAISPGGRNKAVAHRESLWIDSYTAATPGNPKTEWENGMEFYCLHATPSQICFDTAGNLYAATATGIQVCDHNGRVRAILNAPNGSVERMLFIGNKMIIESGGELFCRELLTKGSTSPFAEEVPKSQGQG